MRILLSLLFCLGLSAQSLPFPGPGPLNGAPETITQVGSGSATSTTTLTISLSPSVTAGQGIILPIRVYTTLSAGVSSCTATNATFATPIYSAVSNSNRAAICTGYASGTVSSVTITISASGNIYAGVFSASKVAPSSWQDLSVTATGTSSTATTGTTTGSLSSTEIVFNALYYAGVFNAYDSGYTGLGSTFGGVSLVAQWKEASSGQQSGTMTQTTSTYYAGALVTIKEQ